MNGRIELEKVLAWTGFMVSALVILTLAIP
jgi:hypothetical protein